MEDVDRDRILRETPTVYFFCAAMFCAFGIALLVGSNPNVLAGALAISCGVGWGACATMMCLANETASQRDQQAAMARWAMGCLASVDKASEATRDALADTARRILEESNDA